MQSADSAHEDIGPISEIKQEGARDGGKKSGKEIKRLLPHGDGHTSRTNPPSFCPRLGEEEAISYGGATKKGRNRGWAGGKRRRTRRVTFEQCARVSCQTSLEIFNYERPPFGCYDSETTRISCRVEIDRFFFPSQKDDSLFGRNDEGFSIERMPGWLRYSSWNLFDADLPIRVFHRQVATAMTFSQAEEAG